MKILACLKKIIFTNFLITFYYFLSFHLYLLKLIVHADKEVPAWRGVIVACSSGARVSQA